MIKTPAQVLEALSPFDDSTTQISLTQVAISLSQLVRNPPPMSEEEKRGLWAERVAFMLRRPRAGGQPQGPGYFHPWPPKINAEGLTSEGEDDPVVDEEVLRYWLERARKSKHPTLSAHYSDLVWDIAGQAGISSLGREKVEAAKSAVSGYISAANRSDGSDRLEQSEFLLRALQISRSIGDTDLTRSVIEALIEYVERTSVDEKVGTYLYMGRTLLSPDFLALLLPEQLERALSRLERGFRKLCDPDGENAVDPYCAMDLGNILSEHYNRAGLRDERERTLQMIGRAFEHRASMGDPLSAVMFLGTAREYYQLGGDKSAADRAQLRAEKLGSEAEGCLVPHTLEVPIEADKLEAYLATFDSMDATEALKTWTRAFLPRCEDIDENERKSAEAAPLTALLAPNQIKFGLGHIEAQVGDDTGDPDGKRVHQFAQHAQLQAHLRTLVLERIEDRDLTIDDWMKLVDASPLVDDLHKGLIKSGLQSYLDGAHALAIHVLVPQIERLIVNILPAIGIPRDKPHRSGRGYMQSKTMNDALSADVWPKGDPAMEDVRLHLIATLSHPKGMNIRNAVCHGLLPSTYFGPYLMQSVLHALLVVLQVQLAGDASSEIGPADTSYESGEG